jgi:hypothetical protein
MPSASHDSFILLRAVKRGKEQAIEHSFRRVERGICAYWNGDKTPMFVTVHGASI